MKAPLLFLGWLILSIVTVAINLAVVCGIIWFALWALQQFGVI